MKRLILILALLALVCIGSAATISTSAVSFTYGDVATSTVLLDSAPAGLAGCNVTVSVANTSVATIAGITFDTWASPHSNTAVPANSVTFTEADFGNIKQAGATNIVLAYITVQGVAPGVTTLNIVVTACDDDTGTAMNPSVSNGTIDVASPPAPVSAYPGINFKANTTFSDTSPITVQFYDLTTGTPTSWLWDFGDGNTSMSQNPTHVYTTGWWDVHLTATNAYGSNTDWKHYYIHVAEHFTRATATGTIAPIDTAPYNMILNSFGGNRTPANESEAKTNWTMLLMGTTMTYTDLLGMVAILIIFAIPFILLWLSTGDLTLPGIVWIIIGAFVLVFVPAEWHGAAIFAGVMAIVAVLYSLYTRRE